jgi:hypothetical protein
LRSRLYDKMLALRDLTNGYRGNRKQLIS